MTDDPKGFVGALTPAVDDYRKSLAAARKEIEPLSDSDDKTKALKALDSLDSVLTKLDDFERRSSTWTRRMRHGSHVADIDAGDDALNQAVKGEQRREPDGAEQQSNAALASYTAARDKAVALDGRMPGVGFADVVSNLSVSRRSRRSRRPRAAGPAGQDQLVQQDHR